MWTEFQTKIHQTLLNRYCISFSVYKKSDIDTWTLCHKCYNSNLKAYHVLGLTNRTIKETILLIIRFSTTRLTRHDYLQKKIHIFSTPGPIFIFYHFQKWRAVIELIFVYLHVIILNYNNITYKHIFLLLSINHCPINRYFTFSKNKIFLCEDFETHFLFVQLSIMIKLNLIICQICLKYSYK